MATFTIDWRAASTVPCRGGALTIGNFDGVHRGHAALVDQTRRQARSLSAAAVALTFDPHPIEVLRPGTAPPPLTTTADRAELLHGLGLDHVVILRTTPELLSLSAADFFEGVLRQGLATRALVEGPNFGFGRRREGNVALLAEFCRAAGVTLDVLPPVLHNGAEVSSSRVRALLLAGDVAAAADLLGRPYRLHGVVGEGQRRGRTLGFPTANLEQLRTLAPGDGVYAATALLPDGSRRTAAVNVGPNPTFGEQSRKVEAHLLDFAGDLYGKELALDFVRRIRDTRPFDGPADLVEQLRRDVDEARHAVSEGGPSCRT
jgi:riboflavin kinase/FMN adenylyltransferase